MSIHFGLFSGSAKARRPSPAAHRFPIRGHSSFCTSLSHSRGTTVCAHGPRAQRIKRLSLTQVFRALQDCRRNPVWKWHLASDMSAGLCVLFMHLRNLFGWKLLRQSHQRRPKPTVNEGHLSIDQTANEHIFRISHRLEDGEYEMAFGMRPPASFDWFFGYRLC